MTRSFDKENVLEFIKANSIVLRNCFLNGDFDIFNDEHLMVIHAVYR